MTLQEKIDQQTLEWAAENLTQANAESAQRAVGILCRELLARRKEGLHTEAKVYDKPAEIKGNAFSDDLPKYIDKVLFDQKDLQLAHHHYIKIFNNALTEDGKHCIKHFVGFLSTLMRTDVQ